VLADFEHLNLAAILSTSSLEHLVTIKEPVYPELVRYFYSSLSFQDNHIRSRILGKDINITLERFAHLLHLSCEGVDIYNVDLHKFEYPDGQSVTTASLLLHNDDNPTLVRNEEVKYYTLTAQVLSKIVFYNILPKSGEYSHARGSAPLLIYCLLKGIRVNIPKLIVDYMASKSLMIPNCYLPFGMLVTRLLKQLKIDLSTERSIEPSIDINSSLLKRMRVRERVPTPQPLPIIPAVVPRSSSASSASFDPYSALSAQLREHSLNMSSNFQRLEQRVDNNLQYICASIRYLQTCVDDTYSRNAWPIPFPRGHSQPLPMTGPPFDTWVSPPAASEAPTPPEDPDFQED